MELKVTKDYSFPEARRLVERSMGPVTHASVAAMSGRPRSSPRQTPRTRVQLDPEKSFSKYAPASNSPLPGSADPEQRAVDVTTDPANLGSISSKEDDTTSIHSNDSLPPVADNSSSQDDSQDDSEEEGDNNDEEEAHEQTNDTEVATDTKTTESDNESSVPQEEDMDLSQTNLDEGAAVSITADVD
jgi:hypothetical protein